MSINHFKTNGQYILTFVHNCGVKREREENQKVGLMGNSESSSSQSPTHGNDYDPDKSKENETEEETSAAGSALKVGAAVAGTALLALGAWSLSSSSDSTEKKANKVGVMNLGGAGGAGGAGGSNPDVHFESHRGDYNGSASRLIRIMSYNVWFREDVEVMNRMVAIGQLILKHSPDVIFFQEVTPNIYQIFQISQWWKLYRCSVSPERATRKYFCMLLSKLPVKRFFNKCFENSNMGREICVAELDVGSNNSLVVASSHLESPTPPEMNSSLRRAQAKQAISQLNNLPNVVFGGDMNWDDNFDGLFPLHGAWVDAWTEHRPEENGWTYDTKANQSLRGHRPLQKRLDRFVCKLRDFEIIGIEMIGMEAIPGLSYRHKNKENPVYPSDHFGLLLTISTI